jgi:hypothetical protein
LIASASRRPPLAHNFERVIAAVLVQVADPHEQLALSKEAMARELAGIGFARTDLSETMVGWICQQ